MVKTAASILEKERWTDFLTRVKRENRLEEALRLMRATRAASKVLPYCMSPADARTVAQAEAVKTFRPLSISAVAKMSVRTDRKVAAILDQVLSDSEDATEKAAEEQTAAVPVQRPLPECWGELSCEGDLSDDVLWVYHQKTLVIEQTARGPVMHWERASVAPPSQGAIGLMEFAADNRVKFYELLQKVQSKTESVSGDDQHILEEDLRADEVEGILKKLQESRA